MQPDFLNKQKSLKRRFLLILGIATFVCVTAMGLMIMFWDKLNLDLEPWKRYLIGGLFILYGVLRFVRIFKKQPYEEI
jgi:cytochrome c biogenesis protein CcdA